MDHVFIFDTYAYALPENGSKWLLHIDLFSKSFFVFPVFENKHWSLAIVQLLPNPRQA